MPHRCQTGVFLLRKKLLKKCVVSKINYWHCLYPYMLSPSGNIFLTKSTHMWLVQRPVSSKSPSRAPLKHASVIKRTCPVWVRRSFTQPTSEHPSQTHFLDVGPVHSGCFYTNSSELGQLAYSKPFSSFIPIQNDSEYLEYFLFTFYVSPNTLSLYNDLFVMCPVVRWRSWLLQVTGSMILIILREFLLFWPDTGSCLTFWFASMCGGFLFRRDVDLEGFRYCMLDLVWNAHFCVNFKQLTLLFIYKKN